MKLNEVLHRITTIYNELEEDCFQYIGAVINENAELDISRLEELSTLLNFVYECSQDVLVGSILTKLDYGQPIYQFAMLKPISLEGNEDKLDILYEEKVKVERAILDVYTAQRKKLLTQAAEDLKELHYELQTYVYACNI
ncbi:hypothetical protein [Priestia megaterium]|uniref:hypothetical protein n=1 Tax=Priestia megaterium TaxID=1404 RepID=UPI001BE5A714|nr:hypothetical protein [Priestia megaterium]MBT2257985.1 hypothetical protein [Priestia megaterium]MBT2277626.1 hypothetical protein [Priestia megaterium]